MILSQRSDHFSAKYLYNRFQSAYRPGHSTETALLKIVNDLLLALEDRNVSLLALLGLSAALDTIDQIILLHRLHHDFGIQGTALDLPYKPHSVGQHPLLLIRDSYHLFRCSRGISPRTCLLRSLYNSSFYCNWKALRPSSLIRWRLSAPKVCTPSSNPWPLPLYAEMYWWL